MSLLVVRPNSLSIGRATMHHLFRHWTRFLCLWNESPPDEEGLLTWDEVSDAFVVVLVTIASELVRSRGGGAGGRGFCIACISTLSGVDEILGSSGSNGFGELIFSMISAGRGTRRMLMVCSMIFYSTTCPLGLLGLCQYKRWFPGFHARNDDPASSNEG